MKKVLIVIINITLFLSLCFLFIDRESNRKIKELKNISVSISPSLWNYFAETPELLLKNYLFEESHYTAQVKFSESHIFIDLENHDSRRIFLYPIKKISIPIIYGNRSIGELVTEYPSMVIIPISVTLLIQVLINIVIILFLSLNRRNRKISLTNKRLEATLNNLKKTTNQLELNNIIIGISHKFNTPIGIGVTAISYLKDGYESSTLTKDKFGELIDLVGNSLNRMVTISERIKMLKLELKDLHLSSFNMMDLIVMNYNSYQSKYSGKRIKLEFKNISERVESVELVWNMIIRELLDNAFHFSPNDSVITISTATNERHFHFSLTIHNSQIHKHVRDTVLQPFITSSTDEDHLGLGLFLVRNLVEKLMSGELTIKSFEDPVEILIDIPLEHRVFSHR